MSIKFPARFVLIAPILHRTQLQSGVVSDFLKMVRCRSTEYMSEGMSRKQIVCKLASVCEGQVRVLRKERCPWKGVLEKA